MNSDSITLELDAKHEGEQTASQTSLTRVTVAGLALLAAQYSAHAQYTAQRHIQLPGLNQESAQTVSPVRLREADVLSALLEFHGRLLAVQEELSADARNILDANLWRLYD